MDSLVEIDVDVLVARIRTGDRDAAAEFIRRFGGQIRRRVRGKLGPAMQRLFDSCDILSTVTRRLDMLVRSGNLRGGSTSEFWGLVFRIADHSLIEKARVMECLESREGQESEFARGMMERMRRLEERSPDGAEVGLEEAFRALDDETDRQILNLWLQGNQLVHIGECVGLSQSGVRKRWERIRSTVIDQFELEMA